MPVYKLQGPDGKTYTVEGPAGATADQLGAYVTSQAAAQSLAVPQRSKLDLRGEDYDRVMNYSGRDAVGGAIRGAGSIGATVARPFESAEENEQRRTRLDENMAGLLGSDPNSTAFKTNKLITEVAGTAGVGGLLAKALRAIPGVASALPTLIPAIESAGMTANGATGAAGMATRMAGGAVNGAASAGLVDPQDAALGGVIGAAGPVVAKTAGAVGEKIGQAMNERLAERLKEFSRKAPLNQTIKESIDAGYVIPPASVKPTLANQVIESVSGKQATQQIASTKNNEVTEGLVRKSLGLADDAPLSAGTLDNLRKTAGKAYAEVSGISPQAAADLEALKTARNEAQGWFKAYNRSARPDDLLKAKEARALSDSLEQALETHAADAGRPELIPALQDARKQIAKTYTVGRALNDASGAVDARVLGRMHEKGLPLSDGLDTAGKFASAFPTVAKTPQQIGSPATHNLKSMASLLMGGGATAAMGPAGLAAGAVPFVAPPMARALMFREGAQKGLVQAAPTAQSSQLAALLRSPEMQEMLLRSAPVMGASTNP